MGDTVVLGTSGPLTVFADCFFVAATGRTTIQVLLTSSEPDWLSDRASGELAADEVIIEGDENTLGPPRYINLGAIVSAVSPSGHYIGGNKVAVGLNVFGFPCLVAGQIVTSQAPL